MTTALVIGNGNLLINIDDNLQLTDFYFPHVGQENHLSHNKNQMFFRINRKFYMLNHTDWDIKPGYSTDSLVAESTVKNHEFNISIHFIDYVLPHENIYIREFIINNDSKQEIEIFVYFQNNFAIYESDIGDTAVWYHPARSLVHYKKDRYIALGSTDKIYQFTCAAKSDNHGKGAYPDIDTGELFYNPISNGSINSCISFKYNIAPGGHIKSNYYHVMATNLHGLQELINRHCNVIEDESSYLVTKYWRNWINTKTAKYFDSEILLKYIGSHSLVEKIEGLYKRSLLTIRTQIDNHGAIVAANDGRYLKEDGKDTYSYLWPRDGAYISLALIECGFKELTDKFFEYCSKLLTPEGYFLHKYYPYGEDSALGSSWHPWIDKVGDYQLPIQEDGTALMLYAMWKHYEKFADQEFLSKYWESMIFPMGNFIGNYRYTIAYETSNITDYVTGFKIKPKNSEEISVVEEAFEGSRLPRPSYDLWEERKGINTYTCSSVYAGLLAAAKLASAFGKGKLYETFYKYAQEVKEATIKYLYNPNSKRFISRLACETNVKKCEIDMTIDSSLYGIWHLGMLSVDDEMVTNTMQDIISSLQIKNNIGGIARRENDYYNRIDPNIPGNPWFICTLWVAQYFIQKKQISKAIPYIKWVIDHADATGLIAEQANPVSGHGESVKPLTWSHAEFVRTINMLLEIS